MKTLNALNKKIKECERCHNNAEVLLGEGNKDVDIMILGESPSLKKSRNNIIFGGRSKEIFFSFVDKIGLEEDDYYLTNGIKCYTPDEGTGDIDNCKDYLMKEIDLIDPEYVITLGKTVSEVFDLNNYNMKGYKARSKRAYPYTIITCFHPMYVVYRGITKEEYIEVAERVRNILKEKRWFK